MKGLTDIPELLLENQLCFPLYAAARNIVNRYTPHLKPLQLTYTQYLVMLVLWEYGDTTVGDIGKRLLLDNGTLTPMLKKMEEAGLLTRTRSKDDLRVVQVALTDAGLALRERAKEIPHKIGGCVPLNAEDARQLYGLLYQLLETDQEG